MEKEQKVKPNENVEIEWTDSPYHQTGGKSTVHRVQAEKLIKAERAKVPGTETKSKNKNK